MNDTANETVTSVIVNLFMALGTGVLFPNAHVVKLVSSTREDCIIAMKVITQISLPVRLDIVEREKNKKILATTCLAA